MKQISRVFGVSPAYAERLMDSGVRTLGDLAAVSSIEELSARSGLPADWLAEWQAFSREKVAASQYRRKVAAILAVVALVSLASFVGWSYRKAKRLAAARDATKSGNSYSERGNYDAAIAAYRKAIALKPDYMLAYSYLGLALIHKGQYDGAIAAYRQAVTLHPDTEVNHFDARVD